VRRLPRSPKKHSPLGIKDNITVVRTIFIIIVRHVSVRRARILHTYSIYRYLIHYIIRFESRLYVFIIIIIIIICTCHWIALYADRPLWLYRFYWNEEKRRSGSPGRLWRLRYYILLLLPSRAAAEDDCIHRYGVCRGGDGSTRDISCPPFKNIIIIGG